MALGTATGKTGSTVVGAVGSQDFTGMKERNKWEKKKKKEKKKRKKEKKERERKTIEAKGRECKKKENK